MTTRRSIFGKLAAAVAAIAGNAPAAQSLKLCIASEFYYEGKRYGLAVPIIGPGIKVEHNEVASDGTVYVFMDDRTIRALAVSLRDLSESRAQKLKELEEGTHGKANHG